MRTFRTNTILLAALLASAMCTDTTVADLVAYDDFESYNAAAQLTGSGGSGWSGGWTAPATVTVEDGVIPGYGKSVKMDATGDIADLFNRALTTPQTGETLYMGFLVRLENMMEDNEFLQFYLDDGGGANVSVSGGIRNATDNPFFARVFDGGTAANTVNSTINAVNGTTYQVVLKFNRTLPNNYSDCRLYINQATEGTPDAAVTGRDAGTDTLSAFHVRIHAFDADTQVYFDELRIATTYTEALAPQPELLAYESFEPASVGSFASGNKGDLTWNTYGGDIVDDKDLTYNGGSVLVNAGVRALFVAGSPPNNDNFASFTFAQQANDVYFSFLASTTAGVFLHPYVSDNADNINSGSAVLNTTSGDLVYARLTPASGNTNSVDIGGSQGVNTFIVGKLSKSGAGNYDTLEMLVNPTSPVEPDTWAANISRDIGIDAVDTFGIRIWDFGAGEGAWIDEVRIGTTFAAVVPPAPKGTVVSIN